MTVIAWDGKTLAADRILSSGGFVTQVTKIHHINGCAIAVFGTMHEAMRLLAWYRDGFKPAEYPKPVDASQIAQMVAISPESAMAFDGPEPYEVYAPCAWGYGRDYAQAAMHMGANAQRAVEVANALCSFCGKGLDVIDLETMEITRVKE